MIYLISTCFLFYEGAFRQRSHHDYTKQQPYLLTKLHLYLRLSYDDLELADLHLSYVSGVKSSLDKATKTIHEKLHLLHLFTPSGLHLAGFYLLLSPLLKFLGRKRSFPLKVLLCLLPLGLPGLYSIKRISLVKLGHLVRHKFSLENFSSLKIFYLTFLLDFIFGSYSHSPLSWILSFLFLGTLLSLGGSAPFCIPFALLTAQAIASTFIEQDFNLLGGLLGILLSTLFTLVFPLLLLNSLSLFMVSWNYSEFVLKIFFSTADFFTTISANVGSYQISLITLFTLLLFTLIQIPGVLFLLALQPTSAY